LGIRSSRDRNGSTELSTLRLPSGIRACLFDLDGVLTDTADLHEAAWKQMFDAFLSGRDAQRPFSPPDYEAYVDGKPRYDGVASFLASRGIKLPLGSPSDPPDAETVYGLGNRKNRIVRRLMRRRGVTPFSGSVLFVRAARRAGLRTAVVTASANGRYVLEAGGIGALFDAVVDGSVAERKKLRGKPAPDTYLAAARELGIESEHAAVFEDAVAGVESGRAGRFGYVVGVDRDHQLKALLDHGADVVVRDLAELVAPP
jgi:beta-phosphoglucomutase family hydrolase